MEEGVRDMSRNQDALDAEINPSSGQVGEGNTPIFLVFVDVGFERKMVDPVDL
jgi:hypothetical protein